MNFSAHSAPIRPAIELRTLRRSLNTPVLAIAELPVGPGSAAIAVHVDPRDSLSRYTLAVRCERSREVVFFSARDEDLGLSACEEDRGLSDSSLAAEAALSLAEGMGFLFEEELAPISVEAAAMMWEEFVGSANPSAAVDAPLLLTKFRRPTSWATAGSAAASGFEAGPPPAARGAEAGFETFDTQIAREGDR
jgi:hypothetical protein